MIVIILAGGEGKRMNSNLPKVLHRIREKPMIVHVIETALLLNPEKIFIVVGKHYEIIKSNIEEFVINSNASQLIEYCHQVVPNGTGGAILSTLEQIKHYKDAIILSGDVPLISYQTLSHLNCFENGLLITELENPYGNGRIVFGTQQNIVEIVEEKDCDDVQRKIKYVNCGIYKFQVEHLLHLIPQITNQNKNNEYYLTDIVKLCNTHQVKLNYHVLESSRHIEIHNINTQDDLKFVIDIEKTCM